MRFLLETLGLLVFIELCMGKECNGSVDTAKVTVTSERNSTGHWNTQLRIEHGGGPNVTVPWEVDLEHTAKECDDNERVVIKANVSVPPLRSSGVPLIRNNTNVRQHEIPEGYTLIPGLGYYKLHLEYRRWQDANRVCVREGSRLLVIDSEEELQNILRMRNNIDKSDQSQFSGMWMHVGYSDHFVEGQYVDVYGEPMKLVSGNTMQWDTGAPEGGTAFQCVKMNRHGALDDEKCNNDLTFICEHKML